MDRRQALNVIAGAGIAALSRAQSTGDTAQSNGQLGSEMIDRGITFLDNCWDYSNGECEVRMGKAYQVVIHPQKAQGPGSKIRAIDGPNAETVPRHLSRLESS